MAVSISDVKLKSAKPEEKPYRIPVGVNLKYLSLALNQIKAFLFASFIKQNQAD